MTKGQKCLDLDKQKKSKLKLDNFNRCTLFQNACAPFPNACLT